MQNVQNTDGVTYRSSITIMPDHHRSDPDTYFLSRAQTARHALCVMMDWPKASRCDSATCHPVDPLCECVVTSDKYHLVFVGYSIFEKLSAIICEDIFVLIPGAPKTSCTHTHTHTHTRTHARVYTHTHTHTQKL